jgi:ATP-dependent Clp protease protease subunit
MIYQKHLTKPHTLDQIGMGAGSLLHLHGLLTWPVLEKIMERDLFMGADEAKEMGLVDEILIARKKSSEFTTASP